MIDSGVTQAQVVRIDESPYVIREQSWGQPPASQYAFITVGEKLYGHLISDIYVSSQPGIPMSDLLSCEEEPEDTILIASGVLPRLIDQAQREPPSLDWERDLNEL